MLRQILRIPYMKDLVKRLRRDPCLRRMCGYGNGTPRTRHLVEYAKERHAEFIATHGTLSDEIVWLNCQPEEHYKVGTKGHVGNVPADIDILDEKTAAALLDMPELALWEHVRDKVAEVSCAAEKTKPIGLAVGSTPLQVPMCRGTEP